MRTMICNPIGLRYRSWILFVFSWVPVIGYSQTGCTDIQASNFNPVAMVNDGSCLYPSTIAQPETSVPLNAMVNESSGLFFWNEKVWTHNDDTDGHFYAIDTLTGEIMDTINWSVLTNFDWEEVQCNEDFVVIGDIGNNLGNRTDLRFFVIPYNAFDSGDLSVVDTISFEYEDQTDWTPSLNNNDFDAEAFLLTQDSIFIFSKCWSSMQTKRYALPLEVGIHIAQRREEYNVQGLITGASWDDLKEQVVLCGYSNLLMPFSVLLFDYSNGQFFNGNKRKIVLGMGLHQVEAVVNNGNGSFLFSNEAYDGVVNVGASLHRGWMIDPWVNSMNEITKAQEPAVIYPNPSTHSVSVQLFNPIHGAWRFSIFNEKGQQLDKGKFHGSKWTYDVSELPPGFYTIQLLIGQKEYFYRMIKE